MGLRLGDILVEKKIITKEQLDLAIKEHQKSKDFLGQTLIKLGMITEGLLSSETCLNWVPEAISCTNSFLCS